MEIKRIPPVVLSAAAVIAIMASAIDAQSTPGWINAYRDTATRLIKAATADDFAWQRLAELTDAYGNLMPAGTTINFSALFGDKAGAATPSSYSVVNVVYRVGAPALPPAYPVSVTCPAGAGNGILTVDVETPNGVGSRSTFTITN